MTQLYVTVVDCYSEPEWNKHVIGIYTSLEQATQSIQEKVDALYLEYLKYGYQTTPPYIIVTAPNQEVSFAPEHIHQVKSNWTWELWRQHPEHQRYEDLKRREAEERAERSQEVTERLLARKVHHALARLT